MCQIACEQVGILFTAQVLQQDFVEAGVSMLRDDLLAPPLHTFTNAILNPPYGKINSNSNTRKLLRSIGIEANNLYTAFVWLVIRLLDPQGELVAITPRSFCNGPYFRPFRRLLFETMRLRHIHVFDSRSDVFSEDEVLQENVILHALKERGNLSKVIITSSHAPQDKFVSYREVDYDQVVQPSDPESFIHLVSDELGQGVVERMRLFKVSLDELGLTVSTGRVVDFRVKDYLRTHPEDNTVPLIYPSHFRNGFINWPALKGRKPNAIVDAPEVKALLVPEGIYVLVKRFSTKEERRRVVAAIYDPSQVQAKHIGFENHLNYYHLRGGGLSNTLARGLAVFLNSTLVDEYFRQFNGHTQVNATDLRNLKYPTQSQLERLGAQIGDAFPPQNELDNYIEELLQMTQDTTALDPVRAKRKIEEAQAILKDLGFPPQQQNERSALTLLALLDLKSTTPWSEARNTMIGITPMMEFFAQHYGKHYAPNSRETVRRQTVHQFVDAGLVIANPDMPTRPINSGKTVYQIEPGALELIRTYGMDGWGKRLKEYLASIENLKHRYVSERQLVRIPLTIAPGKTISLSPGGQNVLVQKVIEEFCPRFTPGAIPIYVGDTDEKFAYFDQQALGELGVAIEPHGKMPDVVVYYASEDWLVLIEAVTSHGPVNLKRRNELRWLFKESKAGLVLVTAFLDRTTMKRYLNEISWETEVWVAEAPDHIIHFNGERFLGPY